MEPARAAPNADAVDAFGNRLVGMLDEAGAALMISVGHRTGLFDAMARLPPATAAELAHEAGLDERYVREWLGAMTTSRVVEYDPRGGQYRLPAHHASLLTRAATPNNFAVYAQYVALLGAVEDRIVECFRSGSGVPYSAFHRFHEVMAEDSGQSVVGALDAIVALVPGLEHDLLDGISVLDVGCGSGRALTALARAYPRSRFTGHDFSEEAIRAARNVAAEHRLTNVEFDVRDAAGPVGEARYDLITAFDAIHDQADPAAVLRGIRQRLAPDGIFLMQDIRASSALERNVEHPLAPFLYAVSVMHCMTVSLAQGGAGLGTMWGEERARAMLAEAGFGEVSVHTLPHDIQNCFYVVHADR
ncbi:class I SAM-dependent methyltransferase [Anaeromyxobacter dehalogenans]|nr:class I SAM-dependent methyltransferase [Anaeromyxobacter dehalogenans]